MAKLYGKNSYNNDWMQLLDLPLKAAQLDISERELAQKQSAQQAFLKAMQGGGLGGDNPPLIKIPDPSSPIGVRLEVDPRWAANIQKEKEVSAEAGKKAAGSQRDFLIAKGKLRTTFGAFKAMAEQAGGSGRVFGFKNLFQGTTGQNPYVKAYQGQLVEAAAALAKLAAPSARVGQEIIAQFKKTLPTQFSTMDEAINQIRFSLHNAFATALGQSGEEMTPEIANQIDEFVKDIIDTPALNLESFKSDKPEHYFKSENEASMADLPKGTVIYINGKRARVK